MVVLIGTAFEGAQQKQFNPTSGPQTAGWRSNAKKNARALLVSSKKLLAKAGLGATANTTEEPYASFSCFNDLPTELRTQIWKVAGPERRIIQVVADFKKSNARNRDPYHHQNIAAKLIHEIPPLLHVCFESREITLRQYVSFGEGFFDGQGGFIDPKRDVLHFAMFRDLIRFFEKVAFTENAREPERSVLIRQIWDIESLVRYVSLVVVGGGRNVGAAAEFLGIFANLHAVIFKQPSRWSLRSVESRRVAIIERISQGAVFQNWQTSISPVVAAIQPHVWFIAPDTMKNMTEKSKVSYTPR